MDKKDIGTCSGCLAYFIAAVLFFKGCNWYMSYERDKERRTIIERHKKDSVRLAVYMDSLARDPHYQDSLRKAEEEYRKWEEEQEAIAKDEIIGYVLSGDTVYHTSFHPVCLSGEHPHGFMKYDLSNLKFITTDDIKRYGYTMCSDCSDAEDVYSKYIDGELFGLDDARDHDLIPVEEAGKYCDHAYSDND